MKRIKLNAKLIFKLAELKDSIAVLQNNHDELVKRIKKVMSKKHLDEVKPSDSPQKLVLSNYDKSQVPWKDEWGKLAKKKYGKRWKKVMLSLQESNKVPCSSLCLERNEKFKPKKKAHNLKGRN